jgi:Bacterial PH domain
LKSLPEKIHLKYDNGCEKQDNYLPLERIQDVDITQNCFLRCWGVKEIKISTAGGDPTVIYGLKDTEGFRNTVLRARDNLVHGGAGTRDDGTGGMISSASPFHKQIPIEEFVEMKQCLLRIEQQIERGLNKL